MKIKSKIQDYDLEFIDDFRTTLNYENAVYLIDANIKQLYNLELTPSISINATEQAKSYDGISVILKELFKFKILKNTVLIGIGGGVIQDIVGFIASVLYRGMEWIFYPTTLLAQADSCIGSKTSINFDEFKNQLGTFYPPSKIYIDVNFIKTLLPEAYYSGIGEMIKIALIAGADGFWYGSLENSIKKALELKKQYIEADEMDKDIRNLLNYGHTFGHAIESASNYAIPHGLAVVIGMDIANYISFREGYLTIKDFKLLEKYLSEYYIDFQLTKDEYNRVIEALKKDKKNINMQALTMILTHGKGKMFKSSLPYDKITDYFYEYCAMRDLFF